MTIPRLSPIVLSNTATTTLLAAILVLANTASAETIIHSFGSGSGGATLLAGLVEGKDGTLYGTTAGGGSHGQGTVFRLTPPAVSGEAWTQTILYNFAGQPDGSDPQCVLIFDKEGNLYGTTFLGGVHNVGTVFELATTGKETVLYSFKGRPDGSNPNSGVVVGWEGSLYGTTPDGGVSGNGTVFRLTKSESGTWAEITIHSFAFGNDGREPTDSLIVDKSGNLYGTASFGGSRLYCPQGCGTVFEVSPPAAAGELWTETDLYDFTGADGDGSGPGASLIPDGAGNLYGVTFAGGSGTCSSGGCGTVFELSPATGGGWVERVLYSFTNGSDGANPVAGLVLDSIGNLYGSTAFGGSYVAADCRGYGCGTIFRLSPPSISGDGWSKTTLHIFKTGSEEGTDGYRPYGALIFGKSGTLYGTTFYGGSFAKGTLFGIQP